MKGIGFAAVPLARVLPEVEGSELRRMVEAGTAIDRARTDEPVWFWDHGSALSTVVCERQLNGDWFEVELEVEQRFEEQRAVEARVNVVCWCEVDHQSHDVAEVRYVCGDGAAVVDAFVQAAQYVITWLGDTHDPAEWRFRIGLPSLERR